MTQKNFGKNNVEYRIHIFEVVWETVTPKFF